MNSLAQDADSVSMVPFVCIMVLYCLVETVGLRPAVPTKTTKVLKRRRVWQQWLWTLSNPCDPAANPHVGVRLFVLLPQVIIWSIQETQCAGPATLTLGSRARDLGPWLFQQASMAAGVAVSLLVSIESHPKGVHHVENPPTQLQVPVNLGKNASLKTPDTPPWPGLV